MSARTQYVRMTDAGAANNRTGQRDDELSKDFPHLLRK